MNLSVVIAVVVGLVIGLVLMAFVRRKSMGKMFEEAQAENKQVLEEARREADRVVKTAIKESKDEARSRRKSFEEESKKKRAEIAKLENKIKQREQTLEKKMSALDKEETKLEEKEAKLQKDELKYQRLIAECEFNIEKSQKTLEKISSMSVEEARQKLMKSLEETARKDAEESIRKIEEEMRQEADHRAKAVVSLAVQRMSSEYVNDATISVVTLPNEDMKGRIIGREGRNIRALEQATGVDLIIDDTPEAVIISCFNPILREIARITLGRLIADGRIHPARIEETAKRVEGEFDGILREYGEQAAFDIGITDLHPDMLVALGKLRFRTAGLQTVLQHSVETANICGIMAGEMKLNIKKAKRAGLLHDIGKSVDQETEGHHSAIGAALCERLGESAEVVAAVRAHHDDELIHADPLSVVVHAANTLSARRPGARKEVLESYIKRLEEMEMIVKGCEGVESAFVLQAGREVRALVSPDGVNDKQVVNISNQIAHRLRQELTFPGQIRVTVLRESKVTEYAT